MTETGMTQLGEPSIDSVTAVPMHVRRTLDPNPHAAGQARAVVRETLRQWGLDALSDDVTLVVSELVTNALKHVASVMMLTIEARGRTLRVSVTDTSRAVPRLIAAAPDDEGGRGIQLVDALSNSWGADLLPSGKRVWAELELPAQQVEPASQAPTPVVELPVQSPPPAIELTTSTSVAPTSR